jgi:hypothetical protein
MVEMTARAIGVAEPGDLVFGEAPHPGEIAAGTKLFGGDTLCFTRAR